MNIISGSWLDNHFDVSLVRYRFTKDKLVCQYAGYFNANTDLQISKHLINNYKTPVKSLIVALLLQNIIPNYKCTSYELLALRHYKGCIYDAKFFRGSDLYNEICNKFNEIEGLKYEHRMKGENGKIISRFKFDLDKSIFTSEKKKDFLTLCMIRGIFQ